MKIRVLYFGELRETIGTASESMTLTGEATVEHLIHTLAMRGDPWLGALDSSQPLRVAVNQEMMPAETSLSEGCEVAFFRPVTGG